MVTEAGRESGDGAAPGGALLAEVGRVKIGGGGFVPACGAAIGFEGGVAVWAASSTTGGKSTVGVVGCVLAWDAFTSGVLAGWEACIPA